MHSKGPWTDTSMVMKMSSERHFLEKPWSAPVTLGKTNNLHSHWEILHFYGKIEFLKETCFPRPTKLPKTFLIGPIERFIYVILGDCDEACQYLEDWCNLFQQDFVSGLYNAMELIMGANIRSAQNKRHCSCQIWSFLKLLLCSLGAAMKSVLSY